MRKKPLTGLLLTACVALEVSVLIAAELGLSFVFVTKVEPVSNQGYFVLCYAPGLINMIICM